MAWQSWQEIGIQESGSFLWVIQANRRAEFERVAGENRREHKKASGYSLYLGVRTCSLGVVGRAEGCWDISPGMSWDIREKRREHRLLCALSPSSSQLSAPEPCYKSFTPSLGCALHVRANTSQVLLNKKQSPFNQYHHENPHSFLIFSNMQLTAFHISPVDLSTLFPDCFVQHLHTINVSFISSFLIFV